MGGEVETSVEYNRAEERYLKIPPLQRVRQLQFRDEQQRCRGPVSVDLPHPEVPEELQMVVYIITLVNGGCYYQRLHNVEEVL